MKKNAAPVKKGPLKVVMPPNVGMKNPYAVATVMVQRKIPWHRWTRHDRKQILEGVFQKDFRSLFRKVPGTGGFVCDCTAPADNCCPATTWSPGGVYQSSGISGLDPVQGIAADCYFIAALSAVAWACRSVIKEAVYGPYYRITLYDESASKMVDFCTTTNLPSNLQYAHSATQGETWPAFYEKAFVGLLSKTGSPCAGIPGTSYVVDTPSMDTLCKCRNVLYCLAVITGWTGKMTKFTRSYSSCTTLWSDIRALTTGNKTKYPVVAWSYADATAAGLDLVKYPDYGIDSIIPRHSYSLLGVYSSGGVNYVVLRDPYGPDGGDPDNARLAAYLGTGTWNYSDGYFLRGGIPDGSPPSPKTLDLANLTDGVFALEACTFKAYFEGWAWVK